MSPRDLRIARVEFDLGQCEYRSVMLQMKPRPRPGAKGRNYLVSCSIRIIGGQPDRVHAGAQVGCGEKITLFERRRKQLRHAARNLGHLAEPHECVQQEAICDGQLPGYTRTLIAQDLHRALEKFGGLLPVTDKISAESARPDGQADRVGMGSAQRQGFSAFHNLPRAILCGATSRRALRCFESHGSSHAINLASAKCQQQMPALKIRTANKVNHA